MYLTTSSQAILNDWEYINKVIVFRKLKYIHLRWADYTNDTEGIKVNTLVSSLN